MSVIDKIDETIEKMIHLLAAEFAATGIFTTPSDERKSVIIEEIAKLRASMSPQCDCKK